MTSKLNFLDRLPLLTLDQAKRFISRELQEEVITNEDVLELVATGGLQPSIRIFDRFTTPFQPLHSGAQVVFDPFQVHSLATQLHTCIKDKGHNFASELEKEFKAQMFSSVSPAPLILQLHIPPKIIHQHPEITCAPIKQAIFSCSDRKKMNSESLYLLRHHADLPIDHFEYDLEIPPLTQWVFLREDLEHFIKHWLDQSSYLCIDDSNGSTEIMDIDHERDLLLRIIWSYLLSQGFTEKTLRTPYSPWNVLKLEMKKHVEKTINNNAYGAICALLNQRINRIVPDADTQRRIAKITKKSLLRLIQVYVLQLGMTEYDLERPTNFLKKLNSDLKSHNQEPIGVDDNHMITKDLLEIWEYSIPKSDSI